MGSSSHLFSILSSSAVLDLVVQFSLQHLVMAVGIDQHLSPRHDDSDAPKILSGRISPIMERNMDNSSSNSYSNNNTHKSMNSPSQPWAHTSTASPVTTINSPTVSSSTTWSPAPTSFFSFSETTYTPLSISEEFSSDVGTAKVAVPVPTSISTSAAPPALSTINEGIQSPCTTTNSTTGTTGTGTASNSNSASTAQLAPPQSPIRVTNNMQRQSPATAIKRNSTTDRFNLLPEENDKTSWSTLPDFETVGRSPIAAMKRQLRSGGILEDSSWIKQVSPSQSAETPVFGPMHLHYHHHHQPGEGHQSPKRYSRRKPADSASPTTHAAAPWNTSMTEISSNQSESSSPTVAEEPVPLHTSCVQADAVIAQPKPISRQSSIIKSDPAVPSRQASRRRAVARSESVIQLEATAQKLASTTSMSDAIRDLHGELKRSDSKRSSRLAAHVKASSVTADTDNSDTDASASDLQLQRHLSNSSIISTNNTARLGGYSPAAFVKSPTQSLVKRLRSSSKDSTGHADADPSRVIPRFAPGRASVRSTRSTNMALAEISESEPISLNQAAFDEADADPVIDYDDDDTTPRYDQTRHPDLPTDDAFHEMLSGALGAHNNLDLRFGQPVDQIPSRQYVQIQQKAAESGRPLSVHSNDTFEQARDAFVDFDGVHWQPNEDDYYEPPDHEPHLPTPPPPRAKRERPQSYFDPSTGQQMLYYPARVPAMLNLPPKLSSNPKAGLRNVRRSQVLDAMVGINQQAGKSSADRQSKMPDLSRQSWLPDPLAGHRNSFAALTGEQNSQDAASVSARESQGEPASMSQVDRESVAAPEEGLRRPPRLTRKDPEKHKSRMSRMDNLPAHLRASAFFDLPSTIPDVEVKDGSAMATLDSILDASANAPVGAFTDHQFAGKLGTEVYGKERRRKSQGATSMLNPVPQQESRKRSSSFMWASKRSTSYTTEKSGAKSMSSYSALGHGDDEEEEEDENDKMHYDNERRSLVGSVDGEHVIRVGVTPTIEEEEDSDDGSYEGAPTTLLAELQLRKQQQKHRTQHLTKAFPDGMHATLLEMDAVAEKQRKERKDKRVNLAWEDPDAHWEQNGSDDEDVPLAIIAAKNAGAKNMADLERPIGLMERRDMEDNEPLSHRRARLQGIETPSMTMMKQQSMLNVSGTRMHPRSHSPASRQITTPDPQSHYDDYVPDDIEDETLAERRQRIAADDEAEGKLPRTRPVSRAFSEEILSQFDSVDDRGSTRNGHHHQKSNSRSKTPLDTNGGEETLGQRRKRLQAEREAREQEMSFGILVGAQEEARNTQPTPTLSRRLSLADVLAAHPKTESREAQALQDRQHMEEQRRLARERDAKLAAMRMQMPTSASGSAFNRHGGFPGGVYSGGVAGGLAVQSSPALNNQAAFMAHQRSISNLSGWQHQQPQPGGFGNVGMVGVAGFNQYGGGGGGVNYAVQNPNLMSVNAPSMFHLGGSNGGGGGSMYMGGSAFARNFAGNTAAAATGAAPVGGGMDRPGMQRMMTQMSMPQLSMHGSRMSVGGGQMMGMSGGQMMGMNAGQMGAGQMSTGAGAGAGAGGGGQMDRVESWRQSVLH